MISQGTDRGDTSAGEKRYLKNGFSSELEYTLVVEKGCEDRVSERVDDTGRLGWGGEGESENERS